jgi:superfamily I DNA/RNA helicase
VEKALAIAAQERLPLAEVFLRGGEFAALPSSAAESVRRFLATLQGLREAAAGGRLVELIQRLVRDVRYADEVARCYPDAGTRTTRWDAVNEILNMAELHARQKKQASLADFLADVTLNANDDDKENETASDKVTLMTLHSAKGLEFGEVYLVGMEEGLLPHARSIQDGAIEEERRLAYVGITRARRRLTMTYTVGRAKYGDRVASIPSRFLYESLGKPPPTAAPPAPSAPRKTARGCARRARGR